MFYKRINIVSIIFLLFLSLTSFTQAQRWIQLISNETMLSAPTARSQHSAVYDAVNSRMIIFGGIPGGNDLNDVWVLSNANGLGGTPSWTQLTTTIRTPEARDSHTAVYDAVNNRMTIYGGSNNQGSFFSDVWVLSNANGLDTTVPTWTEVYPPSDSSPGLRAGHTAVYDTTHNQMIIFGGGAINNYNDVWVLSNPNGLDSTTSTWTQLTTTGSTPTTRSYHTAVYDATNNRMTIFGGISGNGTYLNDIWVLSNANGLGGTPTWTQLSPTGSAPSTRWEHTAVYDATNNRMTIFGGNNAGTFLNDVWVLSHANGLGGIPTWTQILPPGSTPSTRDSHTAIYDATNNRMTIFGGYNGSYLNDVWVLTNSDYITSVPKRIWELFDK